MSRLSRRHLLQLGGTSLAASLLPQSSPLRAAPGGIRRLVIMTTGHGTVLDNWRMDVAKEGEDASFAGLEPAHMSPILSPFYDLREKLLVLDGLSYASAICDQPGNNHGIGSFHALTGANVFKEGDDPAALDWEGMSVDVRIAERVAQEGRYRSLHFTDVNYNQADGHYSRERGGAKIPYEGGAKAIHERLFGDFLVDEVETPATRVRKGRASILDFVRQDYEGAVASVPMQDRIKLELHRDFVGQLGTRIDALANLSCEAPEEPVYDKNDKYARNTALQELIAASFICDLTRVVTYEIRPFSADMLGAPGKDLHQDFAHKSDPEAVEKMTQFGQENAKIVAGLAKTLDSIPDGDGTLLDSTLIVWTGDIADGTHHFARYPYVLLGGGAGMVNTGRYVRYGNSHRLPTGTMYKGSSYVGPAHNHLLVGLCHAMGQTDIEWVGQKKLGPTDVLGPLPGMLT